MKAKLVRRICSVLMVSALTMGLLAGCGNSDSGNNTQEPGTTEDDDSGDGEAEAKDPVTLEWYYAGNGMQEDTEKVEAYVNELLKSYEGLEHVSVNLNCVLADEYPQQVLLAQTSGKQMDIIHTYRLDFVSEIRNGTFLALDDYLNSDEFSALKNELPEWLWESLMVDGQTYLVPNYQIGATDRYILLPEEYAQYADTETLAALRVNDDPDSIVALADEIEKITLAVREGTGLNKYAYPLGESIAVAGNFFQQDVIDKNSGIVKRQGTDEIINLYMDDCFKEACRIAAEWVQEGLLPSDTAVQDRTAWEGKNLLNDNAYALMIGQQYGSEEHVAEISEANYGFPVQAYRLHDNYFMINGWGAGGNGVASTSEHPEEALKFIEALNTEKGKDIYNALVYGLEGEQYEKIDDTHIKTLEYDGAQGLSDNSYSAWKWIIGNTKYAWLNQGCVDGDIELVAEINENPDNIVSDMMGFRVNLDPVSTEVSQCAAVVTEYRDALIWGSLGADWEAYYNEFMDKLEAAGVQKILDEIQTQYDEFRNQ